MAQLIQRISDFLARWPGLVVLIGIGLILVNFVFQLLPAWPVVGWLQDVNLFLHLGLVVSLFGLLVVRVL